MTNLSLINNNDQTMSSVEIAELTGKRHDNVLADIRKMLVEIQSPEKAGDYKDGRGRTQPCLLLTKEETSAWLLATVPPCAWRSSNAGRSWNPNRGRRSCRPMPPRLP